MHQHRLDLLQQSRRVSFIFGCIFIFIGGSQMVWLVMDGWMDGRIDGWCTVTYALS